MKVTGVRPLQRCNSRRNTSSPERFPENNSRPSAWRLCLHAVACLVSLILGFRFSREALLVVVSLTQQPADSTFQRISSNLNIVTDANIASKLSFIPTKPADISLEKLPSDPSVITPPVKSTRVHVGRHEILVRPWPRPDPAEVLAAHALLQRVQQEQRHLYVTREWKHVIVVTPTFSRAFQSVHLTGLMHTLLLVPGPLTWIVVEAGGVTNETSLFLAQSGLHFFHLSVNQIMPTARSQRRSMESIMRIQALRFVKEQKLDGILVFADDSNTHSLHLFDEVQNVKWLGALSVGILGNYMSTKDPQEAQGLAKEDTQSVYVQGPACNESCHLIGWHLLPAYGKSENSGRSKADFSTKDLEWAGFVLNSRILWDGEEKPDYISNWDEWTSSQDVPSNPLGFVKDQVLVEPLGNCGREVLLWWLRLEAHNDSKFPSRWVIDPPLEVTVLSKRTPWLDSSSEKHSLAHSAGSLSQSDKHGAKHAERTSRSKKHSRHGSKRKQSLASRVEGINVSHGQ